MGEKKLVHIEEAGRTLARAVLVGAEAEEAAEAAKERAKAAKARARRKPRQSAKPAAKPAKPAAKAAAEGGEGARPGRRRRPGLRGRDARIEASAPRPQRRTAPFACQGRSQRVI